MAQTPTAAKDTAAQLDTLGQLRNGSENYRGDLLKRARVKYAQKDLLRHLSKLNSPLKKQYEAAQECSSTLVQVGDKITSRFCKHRFCAVCNRIRTANLINGYRPIIEKMENPYFVTLTVPNVSGENLPATFKQFTKYFRLIQDLRRKTKQPVFNCIRKIECTYNAVQNNYHPHIHLIIDSEQAAQEIKKAWIDRNPTVLEYLQDIKPATEPLELFKYFAKLSSDTGKRYYKGGKLVKDRAQYPEALDLIFRAIAGARIVQPMGNIKKVSEEIPELVAQEADGIDPEENIYIWHINDWYSVYTGESLTNYQPNEDESRQAKKIRYLQDG
jgi:hypothetical protein